MEKESSPCQESSNIDSKMKILMHRILILSFFFLLNTSINSYSQTSNTNIEIADKLQLSDSTLILGISKGLCFIGKEVSNYDCGFDINYIVQFNTRFIISDAYSCGYRKYYKVIYQNEEYFIDSRDIRLVNSEVNYHEILYHLSPPKKERYCNFAKYMSDAYYKKRLMEAASFLDNYKQNGLAILSWRLNDESEFTEGTGLKITFSNRSNKTIKYIWTSIVGYNSVGDKVVDPKKRVSSIQVKSVGPIRPNNSAEFEFNYIWFTDLVDNAKITYIKVQYMDGTTKTINHPVEITLDKDLFLDCFYRPEIDIQ